MKIAINGDIIDTKDIYKISKIEKDDIHHISFRFKINLFNQKSIKIEIESKTYFNGDNCYSINDVSYFDSDALEKCINSKIYQQQLQKIVKFRQSIIDIWNEDKSNIPQFNLK